MAIYTERIIKVNNNTAAMDKDIYMYRGNRNIEIQFKIIDYQFKFKDVNLVEQISPSHAYVTLLTPQMKQISTGKAEVIDGTIKLIITSAMIDEKTECGDYTIVVDLYDEIGDSLITIPPVENQLHVLDRMTDIDDVPDELRFVFDEVTGNLEVVNIDVNYDETTGEIKTIENIPLQDRTARRLIDNLEADFEELDRTVDDMSIEMIPIKTEINRLSPIVDKLVDSGYSQIKSTMSQSEIQNVLNDGGIIIFRNGNYSITSTLNMIDNTILIVDKNVNITSTVNDALLLDDISNVTLIGNITFSNCGIKIKRSTNIKIDGINVSTPIGGIGIDIENGYNVLLDNIKTMNCSNSGIKISFPTSEKVNISINNHNDIASNNALLVHSNITNVVQGQVLISDSLYETNATTENCIKLSNNTKSPLVILDKPVIICDHSMNNPVISITKEVGSTSGQVLGRVDINEPRLIGTGDVSDFIKITNDVDGDSIDEVKIIKPKYEVNGNAAISISGDVKNKDKIIIELDTNEYKYVGSGTKTLVNDIRALYHLDISADGELNVDISNAPIGHVCEFINDSYTYRLNVNGDSINGGSDSLVLKGKEYAKLKHLGYGEWVIIDENFSNKITRIEAVESTLTIPNSKYLFAELTTETALTLPDITSAFAEIHLFVSLKDDAGIVYPEEIKWTNEEPDLDSENVYEFIFTKVNENWLIGCVTYV